MNDLAIRVEGLGKQYRIGGEKNGYKTLRDTLSDAAMAPLRRAKKLLQRQAYGVGEMNESIWALQKVCFEVKWGEVVGIIGRNGAGKSTLLKILSRITEPTEGCAEIYGRIGSLLEVGTGFHPELTGRENIYLNGAILGMKKAEIECNLDEIVAFAEIEKFVDTPVKRYSSGMYVRLAFAVAAHLEPEILLVDEVLAVGDIAFQKKCLGKMGQVAKEGRTVLFVSHNMHAVRNLCARAVLLEEGAKAADGEVDDVVAVYLSGTQEQLEATVHLPPSKSEAPIVGRRLRFLGANGSPKSVFRIREKWQIVLEFELTEYLSHVIGAVGIRTVTGTPILTYWSTPKDLSPGSYFVEFSMEVPLKASRLSFVVGLSSNNNTFYYVEDVGNVTIVEVAEGKQPFRASGAGILVTECVSEIKRLDSP
ncbi:MAG: ABC transporter ATP-binding protein [Deltaproteobacteria bacterium]|nr:MAG: ABC transporter ATP-binding protein [Deltaproteobacteria bacterium]